MKTIYIVRSSNFVDLLYFATKEDADDFVHDNTFKQCKNTITSEEVTEVEYDRRMATMVMADGQGDPQ